MHICMIAAAACLVSVRTFNIISRDCEFYLESGHYHLSPEDDLIVQPLWPNLASWGLKQTVSMMHAVFSNKTYVRTIPMHERIYACMKWWISPYSWGCITTFMRSKFSSFQGSFGARGPIHSVFIYEMGRPLYTISVSLQLMDPSYTFSLHRFLVHCMIVFFLTRCCFSVFALIE